ncbi:hypothetical protein CSPX01_16129 [Colletotrichum filicis]|nr:hypothetical protein CSPX01_16129 [Colletotrichum filicis]
MLASLAMYPMTEFRGMTSQEFQVLVAQARSEADNPAFRVSSLPPKQSSFFRVGMPTNIRATLGGSS